jgi:hypothetical protein
LHESAYDKERRFRGFPKEADAFWRSDWTYLATTRVQHIDATEADVKGLTLPKRVIENARRVFRP